MLSLSPRYDLFRFELPKDFLPESVQEKYQKILSKNAGGIVSPIDYLNESIQSVHIPGINDLVVEQTQHESNPIKRLNNGTSGLGRINVEPQRAVTYQAVGNPLEKIERELKVTFRMNQGLYNYYMLYETIFNHYCKHINMPTDNLIYIEILNEDGVICGRIVFKNLVISGIDGLDFSYDKVQRDSGTFDLTFKFNNIDFEFIP